LIARPRTITDADALARARACIIEHGPGVSLAALSQAIGLSPPALVKRFGSKARLVFLALLPPRPLRWPGLLQEGSDRAPAQVLGDVLVTLCEDFVDVGPALAALRMSDVEVSEVFPLEECAPSLDVRRAIAMWLRGRGVRGDLAALADAAVGAAEARGLLLWLGPQFADDLPTHDWAARLARALIGTRAQS